MPKHSFHKEERLRRSKSVEELIRRGKSASSPPVRLFYAKVDYLPSPAQMTVSVPKKLIRKAVSRNQIKRRMREAYRLNKGLIYDKLTVSGDHYELLLMYTAQEDTGYRAIASAIRFLLLKLSEKL